MRDIGVIVSPSRSYEAPVLIFKEAERFIREESLVIVVDAVSKKRYLGVLRNVARFDPLLSTTQRSAIIEKPEIAEIGVDIPYETSYVRILGEITSDGKLEPPKSPPIPRSKVLLVERPEDLQLDLGEGLAIGVHKYTGVEIPLQPDALRYHIAVVGTTGTGKSRLVKAIIDEVLSKTKWKVIIFDHTGMDYAPYWQSNVIKADEIVLDINTIVEGLKRVIGSIENLIEEYAPAGIIRFLQEKALGIQSRELDLKTQLESLTREFIEKLTLEVSKKNAWNPRDLAVTVASTAQRLGARDTTVYKLGVYIQVFAGHYIKRLNRMSKTIDELIEAVNVNRLLVVDLSVVETEVRRVIVRGFLERLWDVINERLEPINTLVVVDEAHNYACERGCYPASALIEKTLREGRKWGLGVILASQRVVDLGPDIRNNVNTVFFSKLQTPYDFDQLRGFVDLAGIRPEILSLLETREFFFAGLGNPLKYPMLIRVREVGEPQRILH